MGRKEETHGIDWYRGRVRLDAYSAPGEPRSVETDACVCFPPGIVTMPVEIERQVGITVATDSQRIQRGIDRHPSIGHGRPGNPQTQPLDGASARVGRRYLEHARSHECVERTRDRRVGTQGTRHSRQQTIAVEGRETIAQQGLDRSQRIHDHCKRQRVGMRGVQPQTTVRKCIQRRSPYFELIQLDRMVGEAHHACQTVERGFRNERCVDRKCQSTAEP